MKRFGLGQRLFAILRRFTGGRGAPSAAARQDWRGRWVERYKSPGSLTSYATLKPEDLRAPGGESR
jgi:hypothetical protein